MKLYLHAFIGAIFLTVIGLDSAWAIEVNDIAKNIVTTSDRVPGLITAISYTLGLLLGATGILKLKEHVENPTQVKLSIPAIRFAIGGAFFALPIVYEAMEAAINGTGEAGTFDPDNTLANAASGLFGSLGRLGVTLDINNILGNFIDAIEDVPGVIAAFAYLGGLYMGVVGLWKLRAHVENPEQTKIQDGFIRLIIGGALFSLPTVYEAMDSAIRGGGLGLMGNVTSILSGVSMVWSSESQSVECASIPLVSNLVSGLMGNATMSNALCGIITSTAALPAFLSALAYLFGLIFGFWGLVKIKDHVENPQTSIWEGVTRLIAGGMFFALPIVIEAVRMTVTPGNMVALSTVNTNTGFNDGTSFLGNMIGNFFGNIGDALGFGGGDCTPAGLDSALNCFMSDIFGPMHVLLNFFGFVAGMIFIMIGISRLIKSTQEGAKGPLGFGTLMTFVIGGALISFNAIIRGFSGSLFGSPITFTYARIKYDGGMSADTLAHAHLTISSILQFMILVGLISFVRGLFIIRDVAEGGQQASMMAGMTHLIGGALAVNLGPALNAVQGTLGIADFGIAFT